VADFPWPETGANNPGPNPGDDAPGTNYGSNGRFLAPIEPPLADSIPISNREELEAIADNLSGNYHLTTDIDLSGTEWVPIGDNSFEMNAKYFTGVFDGQGYVIRNLTITGDGNRFNGLFCAVYYATIKNIGLEGTNIDVNYPEGFGVLAGGISAFAFSSSISNCYNKGNIYATISSSLSLVQIAGICSTASDSSIDSC
jgi:hypothetical protein